MKNLLLSFLLIAFTSLDSFGQNSSTIKVAGNCGMCKKTIEKAANIKGIVIVDWNKDTKMATLTYDSTKTNQTEILKKIALAGYDSEKIKAKKEDYDNLPGCCQYDRK